MAFRRKPKNQSYRKRRYPKKYRKANAIKTVRIAQTIPDRVSVKLSDVFTDDITTSFADTFYEFAMNGCYDPYLGTGGGQPQGFDQWIGMYEKYRVKACKISCYFNNTTGTASPVQLSIVPNWRGDSSIRTYFNPSQLQYCRYRRFINNGGKTDGYVTSYMSIKKIVGTKMSGIDADFDGTVTTNPNNEGICIWYVLVQDPVNGGLSITGQIIVKLTYYVEFYGRRVLADS